MKLTAQKLEAMGAKRVGGPPSSKRRGPQGRRPRKFVEPRTFITEETIADILLPLQLVTLANQREHWTVKHRRAAEQSGAATQAVKAAMTALAWFHERHELGVNVTVTRMGPRRMDQDAVAACAKHVTDGIANGLEIGEPKLRVKLVRGQRVEEWYFDDADPRITWLYGQLHSNPYGVHICIEPRERQC